MKGVEFDAIGGLEMGAVPLISPVSMHALNAHSRLIPGFFVRQKVKTHGTKKLVETAESLNGKKVVILDDVTTTGCSAMEAVEAVRSEGAEVVMVLSIVDREEGAVKFYREQNIPFAAIYTASEFKTANRS